MMPMPSWRNPLFLPLALWLVLLGLYAVVPAHPLDPLGAINPRSIILVVLLIMAINALGYAIARWLGPRHGLPLAGFVSGFISSTATISVLGRVARDATGAHAPAAAGAVLSTIATFIQLGLLLALTSPPILAHMLPVLLAGGSVAALYGLFFVRRAQLSDGPKMPAALPVQSIRLAFTFAAIVTALSVLVALLNLWLGQAGIMLGAVISGLADVHAAAASLTALVNSQTIAHEAAPLGIVLAITANSCTKAAMARTMGSGLYAREVNIGLALVVGAVWLAAGLTLRA